ncbi:MAG: CoA ester lyase [Rhizobiales bacterium]|nr:CoA ester lyase [Hyphomicrobiales bacterium]NRB13210.1 CoA ester lyase [Hyphomicrobiales bacterium]
MRSLLFVPADDAKKQQKALASAADAIILDMEDSVAAANKIKARQTIAEFYRQLSSDKIIIIRINALDTDLWQADMQAILTHAPDYILIPKARSGADVTTINELIKSNPKAAIKTQIIALVTELPESIFNIASFKNSGDALAGLTWGAEDLSAEIGAQTNKDKNGVYFPVYQMARSFCLLGAAHAEVPAIDSVFTNFKDLEGLKAEAERARIEGFRSKMLIHPCQIATVNEVFKPSEAEINHAKRVIEAIENSASGGVAQLNGEMIDQPHYKRALNLIKQL